ncbi:MAG TPA: hypothetical protein DHU96_04730 [Actinobacteria bacterium]|nr:hypothetical protein [Actinomycetota bacterium]
MNALLTGVIGVAATLLGSFSTYLFQSRTAKRAEAFALEERLRQEHLSACTAFAAALTELKRGLVTLWFYRQRGQETADYQAARIECDRLGASAEAARFRVQLVSGDSGLMSLADSAFTAIGTLHSASDTGELREHENRFEAAVREFIQAAAMRLRAAAR